MLDLILDFDDRKDFGYGFTPSELKLYIDFGNGPEEVAIPLESFRTELTVFGKYLSEESLYTGEYPAVKDIPVFVNYMYYEDVVFEKTDRYYLNLRATFPSGSGEVDRSAFLRFFEEQLNTARKKIAEAEAKGTYLLYEARYAPIAYLDDDYLYDGTAYRQMLPFQTVCLETDSGTEFEAFYQKVLQKLRAGGVYDNPLRALHAEEAFSETLNYEEETRAFYLLDGASDFAPFHIDRISVKELEGKTEQEILDILVGRGLMVRDTDGDPLSKVKNVMNYISFDPEILKTEGAQLGDPLTDRILSMIGP